MGRVSRRSSLRLANKVSNKENIGDISNVGSNSGKVKKSKIRPMPDFSKLHKKWEQKFNVNKAQAKKPLTTAQEFELSKKGDTKEKIEIENLEASPRRRFAENTTRSRDENPQDGGNKSRGDAHLLPRESFGFLAKQQQQQGIAFEADSSALQSILDETGITFEQPATAPTTAPGALASSAAHGTTAAVRPSGSSALRKTSLLAGAVFESARMSEATFKRPPLPHRLTGNYSARPSLRVRLLQHRGCEACRAPFSSAPSCPLHPQGRGVGSPLPRLSKPGGEIRNDPTTPLLQRKAERVAVKTPVTNAATGALKSPGRGLSVGRPSRVLVRTPLRSPSRSRPVICSSAPRPSDVRTQATPPGSKRDRLACKLQYPDDPVATPIGQQLQSLEEVEARLEADIEAAEAEREWRNTLATRTGLERSATTGSDRSATPGSDRSDTTGSDRSAITGSDRSVASNTAQGTAPRRVLGELPDAEVARRSQPSFLEEVAGKQAAAKQLQSAALCTPPRPSATVKMAHFASPCVTSPSASRYQQRLTTASSPSRQRRLHESGVGGSPKAPRASALKTQQGRYSPLRARHSSAPASSPGQQGRNSRQQKLNELLADTDKENHAPAPPANMAAKKQDGDCGEMVVAKETAPKVKKATVRQSTVKVLKETDQEYLLLEESYDVTVADITSTLNESLVAMETLNVEAQHLLRADDSGANLAMQLQLIQQKQDELMQLQRALQRRLAEKQQQQQQYQQHQQQQQAHKLEPLQQTQGQKQGQEEQHKQEGGRAERSRQKQPSGRGCGNVVDLSPISSSVGPAPVTVVDLSPILGAAAGGGHHHGDQHEDDDLSLMRTPEKAGSPSLLFKAHKRSPLFPPMESTASESVWQPVHQQQQQHTQQHQQTQEQQQAAGDCALASGLLQMGQQLNTTPHKSTHWKKQMLKDEQPTSQAGGSHVGSQMLSLIGGVGSHVGSQMLIGGVGSHVGSQMLSLIGGVGSHVGSQMLIGGVGSHVGSLSLIGGVGSHVGSQMLIGGVGSHVGSQMLSLIGGVGSPQRFLSGSVQVIEGLQSPARPLPVGQLTPRGALAAAEPIVTPLALRERAERERMMQTNTHTNTHTNFHHGQNQSKQLLHGNGRNAYSHISSHSSSQSGGLYPHSLTHAQNLSNATYSLFSAQSSSFFSLTAQHHQSEATKMAGVSARSNDPVSHDMSIDTSREVSDLSISISESPVSADEPTQTQQQQHEQQTQQQTQQQMQQKEQCKPATHESESRNSVNRESSDEYNAKAAALLLPREGARNTLLEQDESPTRQLSYHSNAQPPKLGGFCNSPHSAFASPSVAAQSPRSTTHAHCSRPHFRCEGGHVVAFDSPLHITAHRRLSMEEESSASTVRRPAVIRPQPLPQLDGDQSLLDSSLVPVGDSPLPVKCDSFLLQRAQQQQQQQQQSAAVQAGPSHITTQQDITTVDTKTTQHVITTVENVTTKHRHVASDGNSTTQRNITTTEVDLVDGSSVQVSSVRALAEKFGGVHSGSARGGGALTVTSNSQMSQSPRCSVKVTPRSPYSSRSTLSARSPKASRQLNKLSPLAAKQSRLNKPDRMPEIGEMSLRRHVGSQAGSHAGRLGDWSALERQLLERGGESRAGEEIGERLLDQEVAFYMSRPKPQDKHVSSPPMCRGSRCHNPLSDILLRGDDTHFVPIAIAERCASLPCSVLVVCGKQASLPASSLRASPATTPSRRGSFHTAALGMTQTPIRV